MLCSIKGRESYIILSVWVNVYFSNKITSPFQFLIFAMMGQLRLYPIILLETLSDIYKQTNKQTPPELTSLSENKEI